MSRGLGPTQKRVLAVLSRKIDGEFASLETSYLKDLAGGDRSNVRRAVRNLTRRGLVRERAGGGRRYLALTLPGFMAAVPLPAKSPYLFYDVSEDLFGTFGLSLNEDTPMHGGEYAADGRTGTPSEVRDPGAKRGKRDAVTQREGAAR